MRLLLLALGLIALPSIAAAQEPPAPRGGGMMMRADADGDGAVTGAEALSEAEARFNRLDADQDGKVTSAERAAPLARRAARAGDGMTPPAAPRPFGRMADPNSDGTLTKAEFLDGAARRFDRLDANRDGRLEVGEMRPRAPRPPVE